MNNPHTLGFDPDLTMPVDAPLAVPACSGAAESGAHQRVSLDLREYSLDKAAERYGAEWLDLLAAEGLNISLAAEFLLASSASVGLREQMRVLVATRGQQLAGVLPYYTKTVRMHAVPMRMICLGGNLIAYHHEIVGKACVVELLTSCLADPSRPWDVFCAEAMTCHGHSSHAIREVAAKQGYVLASYPADAAPFVPIDMGWDDYLRGKSSNFRYNLKRKDKALKAGGAISERWFTTSDDVAELLRCMQEVESTSWKSVADLAVTSKRNELVYYEQIVPFLARKGLLFANAIYLGDEPIAYHLCYRFNGVVGNMKTSFKESHSPLSPGAGAIKSAIQRSFETGASEFDFLGDAQYHKLLWTDSVRNHEVLFVYSNSLRGRLVGMSKSALQRLRRTEFHHVIRRADVTKKKS